MWILSITTEETKKDDEETTTSRQRFERNSNGIWLDNQ